MSARLVLAALLMSCSERAATPVPPEAAAPASERRVPLVFQRRLPACLTYAAAAVAQFHGHDVDPEDLHRAVPVRAAGVAYTDVVAALGARGIHAKVLRPSVVELRELITNGMPLVVGQVRGRKAHALVVEGYDSRRSVYLIMDPANPGRREQQADAIERHFLAADRKALLVR